MKYQTISTEISKTLNDSYLESSNNNTSFHEIYSKCNQLTPKMNRNEKRSFERKIIKNVVHQIESHNDEYSTNRLFGGEFSLREWDAERKRKSFETVSEAQKRSEAEKENIASGKKKRKNHVGNISSYEINTSELESTVSTWDSNTKVVWKQLGEKFVKSKENKTPNNAGQIVKSYLLNKEAEGAITLNYSGKNEPSTRIRRSLKKVGHNVNFPVDMSALKVKEKLMKQVLSGDIDIGVGVVERQYQKFSITETGEVITKTFSVEGRKHPLLNIRKKLFTKYHQYMRLNNDSYFVDLQESQLHDRLQSIGEFNADENSDMMRNKLKTFERTRHLQIWHDASVIANHGHILFCINILYDPAVFYTSKEYKKKYGFDVNIQRKVETPELYMIGRCKSNDEQLAYIQTRVDCLRDLEQTLKISDLDNSYDEST